LGFEHVNEVFVENHEPITLSKLNMSSKGVNTMSFGYINQVFEESLEPEKH
jgi:hypothetical protein